MHSRTLNGTVDNCYINFYSNNGTKLDFYKYTGRVTTEKTFNIPEETAYITFLSDGINADMYIYEIKESN